MRRVASRDAFVAAIADSDGRAAAHLFLLCPFSDVQDLVLLFVERDSLYSIFTMEDSTELREVAARVPSVPIFLVASEEHAEETLKRLIRSPHATSTEALNGSSVALRYLQSNAT